MLKTTLFVLLSLISLDMNAQSAEVLDKMGKTACDCVAKKDLSKIDANDLQTELGMCIINSISDLSEKDRKKIDISSQDAGRKLGEAVAMKMADKCPKEMMKVGLILAKAKNDAEESPSTKNSDKMAPPPPPPPPPPISWGKIEGKVTNIIEDDMVTLVLVDKNQLEQRVIWYSHFGGEFDFVSNPQSLKGKTVEINYHEQSRYLPKKHEYVSYKQITELKVK
jgi:hypothetical protein